MKEKILLALSDTALSKLIEEKLKQEGYESGSVVSGNDVIPKLKESKSDLLLIDTVLPDKSGYDVLNDKSFDKDVTKVPVIIISNTGEAIHIKKIPSTPSIKDYIISSHIEPAEVIEKIEKALGRGPVVEDEPKKHDSVSKNKKILWVEDDKLLSSILSKKIQGTGYTLLKADRGDDALKILETEVPDLVVLDIMLPGMTGLEVLQKIRMDARLKNIPAIMLSNTNKPSYVESAKMLGVKKFMVKAAVSLNEIIFEIDSILK
jgi:DNA-binding response OmpR family regulator